MIAGLSGSLLSHGALGLLLRKRGDPTIDLGPRLPAQASLRAWHAGVRARMGPASGPRAVFDQVAEPLARALEFEVLPLASGQDTLAALLQVGGRPAAVLLAAAWAQPVRTMWTTGVKWGVAESVPWCVCVNGPALAVFDVRRAYGRYHAEFDLAISFESEESVSLLCGLVGAAGLAGGEGHGRLERVIRMCEGHRAEVRQSLRTGVYDALVRLIGAFKAVVRKKHPDAVILDESLIVIYRILFLLFAEARGLVPNWHPVYRDGYTIQAVVFSGVERAAPPRGMWEALQAVARLAHGGCRAGSLTVPPFNGRLFSPAHAPLAEALPLDDGRVAGALEALTTRKGVAGRERIAYADLGVEQLGGVYEHLLDFEVAPGGGERASLVSTGRRKATGSFYTPRPLTEFVVRRTLAPMVREKTPEEILELRVLDPAMGSGAFLVAACRYLAAAYEQALIREGSLTAGDIGDEDRADFRRAVAQRCLFGVDRNPMAVQLARLSLWLATLARGKPLTFLDHRLRAGNSLAGASIDEIVQRPAPGRRVRTSAELPLFPGEDLQASIETAVAARRALAEVPDDTLAQVRTKEKSLAALEREPGPIERWRRAADVWCAAWFSPGLADGRATFRAVLDHVVMGAGPLPGHIVDPILARVRELAAAERLFHWTLEFPEVFHDREGALRRDGGFDVILGNPPWDMVREDGAAQYRAAGLNGYVRGAGQYRLQGQGHTNLYQLFFERALGLLKPGARCGWILPSGFATDQGCSALRRHLFDRATVDTFTTLDNRSGIFPIHRALKFLLLTFTASGATREVPTHSGPGSADALDSIPDSGEGCGGVAVPLGLIARMSGEGLAVPEIRAAMDLELVSSITLRVPAAADPDGWHVHFGRELNATDDRPHFTAGPAGLPVIEGKQLRPFGVDVAASRYRITAACAAGLLDRDKTFGRPRLAYRDVASPTNRQTLIAAIVPAQAVTTHTVFCVKELLDDEAQLFLCGVFNSYVANYLVRMRVGTHVTAGIVARLPVPKPRKTTAMFGRIVACARALVGRADVDTLARLNAAVAHAYGLEPRHFSHVVSTFPLVCEQEREAAKRYFSGEPGSPRAGSHSPLIRKR